MNIEVIECPENPCMQEDMEEIARDFVHVGLFSGKTVLVTGATGLIGSQVVRALCAMNRLRQANIHVIAQIRSTEKAGVRAAVGSGRYRAGGYGENGCTRWQGR